MIVETPVIDHLKVEIQVPQGDFLLGKAILGTTPLAAARQPLWVPYLGVATQVNSQRGGKRSGLSVTMDVGTLNIVILNTADPMLTTELRPGMPIRLLSLVGVAVFTGTTLDVNTSYAINLQTGKITTYVNLTAVDAVADHAATPRYGAIVGNGTGWENWGRRIERLAKSSRAPIMPPYEPAMPHQWRMASNLLEASLAAHFDLACNSVGAYWYVAKDGITRFRAPVPFGPLPGPTFTFTDAPGAGLKYGGLATAFDTRNVVNRLTLTNQLMAHDDDNGWSATTYERTFTDPTSAATWGPRPGSLEVNLYTEDLDFSYPTMDTRAADIFDDFADPGVVVTGLSWNAQDNPAAAAALEVYQLVDVIFQGKRTRCRIVNLKHTITPTRWMIDLQLIGA